MKPHKLLALAAVSSALLHSGIAAAADPTGWYLGGDIGFSKTLEADWVLNNGWAPAHPTPFDNNWVGALKVGKDLGAWRAEVEYAHRSNDAKHFGPPPYDVDNAKGKITSNTLMFNGYYDFTATGRITPFVGAGIGANRVKADDIRKDLTPTDCCTGIVDGSDTVVAAQVMAGFAYQAAPNLDLTFEYRYLFSGKPSFDYATACGGSDTIGSCGVEGSTSDRYRNHSILIGLRYRF